MIVVVLGWLFITLGRTLEVLWILYSISNGNATFAHLTAYDRFRHLGYALGWPRSGGLGRLLLPLLHNKLLRCAIRSGNRPLFPLFLFRWSQIALSWHIQILLPRGGRHTTTSQRHGPQSSLSWIDHSLTTLKSIFDYEIWRLVVLDVLQLVDQCLCPISFLWLPWLCLWGLILRLWWLTN